MTTVYAIIFDPKGYCTLKGLFMSMDLAYAG